RLLPDRLEPGNALLQRIVQFGNAGLDGVVEPVQTLLGFADTLVKLGQMLTAALGAFLAAVEDAGKDGFQPLGLKPSVPPDGSRPVDRAGPSGLSDLRTPSCPAGPWSSRCSSDRGRPRCPCRCAWSSRLHIW